MNNKINHTVYPSHRNLGIKFGSIIFFALSAVITFNSCKKIIGDNGKCANVMCTMQFVMLDIKVITSSSLTSTVRVKNFQGAVIRNNIAANSEGNFTIFTDNDKSLLNPIDAVLPFTVEVIQNGNVVGTKSFNIGRDCCHVFMKETDNTITIP
jgi:hypothetical protein